MLSNKNALISPITGGKMSLQFEWREIEYRKEKFRVMVPYYRCEDTGNQFTTTESDEVWYRQMHQQYCSKYGIPFTDEIVGLRNKYALSAQKMSLILGFGENQWRKYEQGEIPSVSNGRMIRSIMNPKVFRDMVESARGVLTDKEYESTIAKVDSAIAQRDQRRYEEYDKKRVFAYSRGEENGYAPLSLNRLKNLMLYVLNICSNSSQQMWVTKMNKLLFYIDFVSYRERGLAISGLAYRAIKFGPVPERWERVYCEFDEIAQETHEMGDYEGQILIAKTKADMSMFSEEELQIIDSVCNQLKDYSARELSCLSHKEKAWIEHQTDHEMIPYSDAFALAFGYSKI